MSEAASINPTEYVLDCQPLDMWGWQCECLERSGQLTTMELAEKQGSNHCTKEGCIEFHLFQFYDVVFKKLEGDQ